MLLKRHQFVKVFKFNTVKESLKEQGLFSKDITIKINDNLMILNENNCNGKEVLNTYRIIDIGDFFFNMIKKYDKKYSKIFHVFNFKELHFSNIDNFIIKEFNNYDLLIISKKQILLFEKESFVEINFKSNFLKKLKLKLKRR